MLFRWRMPDGKIVYLLIYVDDILFATNNPKNGNFILKKLQTRYDVKSTQKATKFNGFEFNQLDIGVLVNVQNYILAVTFTYDCKDTKYHGTPHEPGKYHTPEEMADTVYAVNRLAVFTKISTLQLLKEAKKILRYLSHSKEYGLFYNRNTKYCNLAIYSDASWGNVPGDSSSLDGHLIIINRAPICWKLKKQNVIAKSSTESELVGITRALSSAEWLKIVLEFLKVKNITWTLMSDSVPAIKLLHGQSLTDSSGHMEMKYFLVELF
eukprot:snap_masked-scaffold_32-processed-gene-0.16-mRNA-1 protein AED:1.00 eAED:1.00 QI:0/0/0/0/1/1/2/0/266